MLQLRPQATAIHTYKISDGTLVAMFAGNRGTHPELDFKVKILRIGIDERPEPPIHTYWVVDLIIKSNQFPREIREIIDFYIKVYKNCKPFDSIEERSNYTPMYLDTIKTKYAHVQVPKTLPIDYVALIIELFCICEKRNEGAYMFRDVLYTLRDYIDGKVDYMHVIKASLPIIRQKKKSP